MFQAWPLSHLTAPEYTANLKLPSCEVTKDRRMRFLEEMTWPEVDGAIKKRPLVLFPVGALEEHGPHLPLNTDIVVASEVARNVAVMLEGMGIEVIITPTLPFAITDCARGFPGSISLREGTMAGLIEDIVCNLAEHGFQRIAVLCSHLEPQNAQCLLQTLARLEKRMGIHVAEFLVSTAPEWLPLLKGILETRLRYDLHAGELETSFMLAKRPNLVASGWPELAPALVDIVQEVATGKRFKDVPGVESGYFGDPARASAEKGQHIADVWARFLAEKIAAWMRS